MRSLVAYWPLTLILVGLPVVSAILYGCERRAPIELVESSKETGEKCAALLENGIGSVRPDSLGVLSVEGLFHTDPKAAADRLSQWLRRPDCREAVPTEPLTDAARSQIRSLLGDEGVARVTAGRLMPFDAVHIRDALLDFSTADNLSRGTERDIDRVVQLFAYVTRTISPQATGSVELPLTAYEAELLGRGSAEGRAWLFANLMRQLRIDSVILRPADATETDPWWVAALLDDGVYLFDAALGLPVPSGKTSSEVGATLLPEPATWSEVVEQPNLLSDYRKAAGLEVSEIDAARLKIPQVELVGSESFWIQPMERLELSLTEDRGVLLYDPLHDTQAGPGLVSRVASAGGALWNADSLGVWAFTRRIREARAELPESQSQRLAQRIEPFLGPVYLNTKGATPVAEPPSRDLWETRIRHMSGRPAPAIGAYQDIRLNALQPDPLLSPNDQSLNSKSGDEAFYWEAQAKFDVGDFDTATTTAKKYIAAGGDRSDESASLIALCLAAQGKTDEAAKAIDALPETTPGLPRLKWFANRWRTPAEQ